MTNPRTSPLAERHIPPSALLPALRPLAMLLKRIRFRLMCWTPRIRLKLWKLREKFFTLSILSMICGLLMILLSLPLLG